MPRYKGKFVTLSALFWLDSDGKAARLAFAIIIDHIRCSAAKQTALPDRGSVIVRVSEPPLILTRASPTASLFTRVVKQTPLVGAAYLRAFDYIY
jgi:hypothetical protein